MTDNGGIITTSCFDLAGRTLWTRDANGIAQFSYDPNGNQTMQIDALGHITTDSYTSTGQLAQQVTAVGTAAQSSTSTKRYFRF
jgi:YD repeat-containing protein